MGNDFWLVFFWIVSNFPKRPAFFLFFIYLSIAYWEQLCTPQKTFNVKKKLNCLSKIQDGAFLYKFPIPYKEIYGKFKPWQALRVALNDLN